MHQQQPWWLHENEAEHEQKEPRKVKWNKEQEKQVARLL